MPARNGGIDFRFYTSTDAAFMDVIAGNLDLLRRMLHNFQPELSRQLELSTRAAHTTEMLLRQSRGVVDDPAPEAPRVTVRLARAVGETTAAADPRGSATGRTPTLGAGVTGTTGFGSTSIADPGARAGTDARATLAGTCAIAAA